MRRILSALSVVIFGFTGAAFGQRAGVPAAMPARIAPMVMPAGARPAAPMVAAAPARPAVHAASAVRPVSTGRTGVHGTTVQAAGTRRPASSGNSRQNVNNFVDEFGAPFASDQIDVPGLGFDYVHFAAVHPNATRNHFNNGFATPFLSGGIYVPVPYYYSEQAAAAPAAEEAASEPSDTAEESANSANTDTRVTASAAPRYSQRLEPSSEYVFVRRDGTVFFAVAFSFNAGNLQYVTKEGMRRSVPLNALDADATQQFNEQRGVTVRLPA